MEKTGKVLLVSVVSIVVIAAIVIGVVATTSHDINHDGDISIGEAVESLCEATDYKDLCLNTLAPTAQQERTAKPKDLVRVTLESTMHEAKKASNKPDSLVNDTTDPYDRMSMDDCRELLQYASHELERALSMVADSEMHTMRDLSADLNNWLTAVISYKSTCLRDIENPELKKAMYDEVMNTTHLTYNAFGIVDKMGDILGKMNAGVPVTQNEISQQIVQKADNDGHPTWLSAPDHKLFTSNNTLTPNAVVAKDGSGQFMTITEALAAYNATCPGEQYVIYVKAGVYEEYVLVPEHAINVVMYGDGPKRTIVTGDRDYRRKRFTTPATATFTVVGNGFIAKSMAFQNTAGPEGGQAVALRVLSDQSAFYHCHMLGYQDTLLTEAKRQFYRNCVIYGTIDFIFGQATVLIQNSKIVVRMGEPFSSNVITADGRERPWEKSGIVIQNCEIVADHELNKHKASTPSYLGRPWRKFSTTMIMESEIGDFIHPEGWRPWNDTSDYHYTCEYMEYANRGPGANTSGRVNWPGFQVVTDRSVAEQYTAGPFIVGDRWLNSTGIQFDLGLIY